LGHYVHVLTHAANREEIEQETAKTPLPNVAFSYLDAPSWAMKLGLGTIRLRYLMWLWAALRRARELESEIDLCHHVSWGSLDGSGFLWTLRLPFFVGPVGGGQQAPIAFRRYFEDGWRTEWFRNFCVRFVTRWNPIARGAARRAKLVLAANTDTFRKLEEMRCTRIRLVSDVALPTSFVPKCAPKRIANADLWLLWVGGLIPRKGLKLALEAISAAKTPVRITIAGNGPLATKLPHWLAELDLVNRADWLGQVDWTKMKELYSYHDVFLFTSLRDTCGFQSMEAMAHGMPVIALDHHGVHDWIPDNAGIKVPVTSPKETIAGLAAAIDSLWREPELREQMGNAAYEYAKKQTWENRVGEIAALYEQYM